MYIIKRGEIQKIEVINKGHYQSEVRYVQNDKIEYVSNYDVIYTFKQAKMARQEIDIKRKFKKVKANRKGELTCCKCQKRGKDLTVDHIIPISYFGDRIKIRTNIELWKVVWDYDNLQILCSDCNRIKDNLTNEEFQKINIQHMRKVGSRLRKRKNRLMSMNHAADKAGFGVSTSMHNPLNKMMHQNACVEIAKMDSRILFLKDNMIC